jgi:hypothetical protein
MSLLDDEQFARSYEQFLEHGWPHLSQMLGVLAPQATGMDQTTRIVLFNFFGRYFHSSAQLVQDGSTIAEAHQNALAEVMADPAVDHLMQTQLKAVIDQGVKRFQEDHA